jgi:hypothetical protein
MAHPFAVKKWALVLPLIVLLTSCSTYRVQWEPQLWTAVEVSETGQRAPVAGALVLFAFSETSSAIVDSSTACVEVATTVTDADGRFSWPASRDFRVVVYKRGLAYEALRNPFDERAREVRFIRATSRERLIDQFSRVMGTALCTATKTTGAIADYLDKVIPDLEAIATSNDEKELLRRMKFLRDRKREAPTKN